MRPRAMETDHGPSFCWYSDGKELELSVVIDFCVVEMNGPRTHIWFIDFVVIMLNSPKFSNASKFDTCPFVWNASLAKPVLRDVSKRTISANETGCCHRAENHECCKKGRVSNNPWTAITEKPWFSNNEWICSFGDCNYGGALFREDRLFPPIDGLSFCWVGLETYPFGIKYGNGISRLGIYVNVHGYQRMSMESRETAYLPSVFVSISIFVAKLKYIPLLLFQCIFFVGWILMKCTCLSCFFFLVTHDYPPISSSLGHTGALGYMVIVHPRQEALTVPFSTSTSGIRCSGTFQ